MNHQRFTTGFPQHQQYHDNHTRVSHVSENETLEGSNHLPGNFKRGRDPSPSPSSSSSSEASWHQSFKRLKVMSSSSGQQDTTAFSTSWQAPQHPAVASAAPLTQSYDSYQRQQEFQFKQQQQLAGQHSSEAAAQHHPGNNQNADYQSMNSLLGSLHMMRRRQQHRSGEVVRDDHYHQQPQAALKVPSRQTPAAASTTPQSSRKRTTNLRISSNLY